MASVGRQVCRCLRGKRQIKGMCFRMFLEGSNWNAWMDRQRQVVPERRGTRVKSSCTCVGLDPRDWQTNSLFLIPTQPWYNQCSLPISLYISFSTGELWLNFEFTKSYKESKGGSNCNLCLTITLPRYHLTWSPATAVSVDSDGGVNTLGRSSR